jgi:hypothetical protein
MEFAEHGTTVAPYVVQALRRYILGPDVTGPVKIGVLIDESTTRDQSAPAVEVEPDSAAAQITADTVPAADPRP